MSPFGDIPLEASVLLIRNATDIGLVIRERRQKLGLDQQTLASQVKVSRQWIVEVEKGKPRAEIGLVLRTIDALGLIVSANTEGEAATGQSTSGAVVDIDRILDDLAS